MPNPTPTRSIIPRDLDDAVERIGGPFAAFVTDNADPLKIGRLRLVIPEVTGPGQVHPAWALPSAAPLGGGETGGVKWGSLFIPPVGAMVRVMFVDGDVNVPVWIPGAPPQGKTPALLAQNYPARRGIVTPSGHAIIFDDTAGDDGDVLVIARGGAAVRLRGDGSVEVVAKAGKSIDLQGDQAGGALKSVVRLGDAVARNTAMATWMTAQEAFNTLVATALGLVAPTPFAGTNIGSTSEGSPHTRTK